MLLGAKRKVFQSKVTSSIVWQLRVIPSLVQKGSVTHFSFYCKHSLKTAISKFRRSFVKIPWFLQFFLLVVFCVLCVVYFIILLENIRTYFAFCLFNLFFFNSQDCLKEFTFLTGYLSNVSEGLVSLKLFEILILFWPVPFPSIFKFFHFRNLVLWLLVINSLSQISPVSGTSRLIIQLAQIDDLSLFCLFKIKLYESYL